MDVKSKTMRVSGAWALTLGIVSIVAGISVGVGCIIAGGKLLSRSGR